MIQNLIKLPRPIKQALMMLFDTSAIIACLLFSFYIRLGFWAYPSGDADLWLAIFASPLLALPIFIRFGIYLDFTRYVGFKSFWLIFQATTLYMILWGLITFMVAVESIPRSIILINWLLGIIVFSFSRIFARWVFSNKKLNKENVIIYGAGSAGLQLSNSLQASDKYNNIGKKVKLRHLTRDCHRLLSRAGQLVVDSDDDPDYGIAVDYDVKLGIFGR